MKKLSLILVCVLVCAAVVFGQKDNAKGPDFDVADFNKKFETAQWLVDYDNVAWKTSDAVMEQDKTEIARLGQDWFCFRDKANVWHAVYGKFEKGKYDLVFHFVVGADAKITRSGDKVDDELLRSYSTALQTAKKKSLEVLPEGSPVHNQYIKRNADKTFNVWMFPAFQPDGTAIYGGEFVYTLDSAGEKITKDESYLQGTFKGFKTGNPREIWLNYRELEKPTLGAIFFVWYYKDYFTKIFIDNSKSTSSLFGSGKEGYSWLHVEKDKEPAAKP